MARISSITKSMENHWKLVEMEALKQKERTHIDLRKEIPMTESKKVRSNYWRAQDIGKLKDNIKRPVVELVGLFKDRYTWDQVEQKKAQFLKSSQPEEKPKNARAKLSDEKFMYIINSISINPSELDYTNIEISANTVALYRRWIRLELQGIKSKLSQRLFNLLADWYQTKYHKTLIRWSGEKVAEYDEILNQSTSAEKELVQKESEIKESLEMPVMQEVNQEKMNEVSQSIVNNKENSATLETINSAPKDQEDLFYGLLIDSNLSSIHKNKDYVLGVLSVYKALNVASVKLVSLKVTEIFS